MSFEKQIAMDMWQEDLEITSKLKLKPLKLHRLGG